MNRREFLKAAGMATASCFLPGFQAWAVESNSKTSSNKKLVVVFLRGAIDGLNVVVPHGDPAYYSMRQKIALQAPGSPGTALALDRDFALHPSLAALMPLWQKKKLAFVLNAGSPDPTRSHFDAQDYMETGMPGNKVASTGWMQRLLAQMPDNHSPVRAINVGSTTPRILAGPIAAATYAPSAKRRRAPIDRADISSEFQQMYKGRNDDLEHAFLEGIAARNTINTALAGDEMNAEMQAANGGALAANKFGGFGKQLGKLMHDEAKVQVAFVALGGFDTHVNQGNEKGQLANQLNVLGTGLSELSAALGPSFDDTTIMVISEFGRTAKENGNGGTDHGHGNLIWLLGGDINGGKLYGRWNGMSQKELYEGRDLPVSTDFRSVISSVIGEHLRLSQSQLEAIFPGFKFTDKSLSSIIV
ncbi:MAG: DUF1501 domain-containing protein [Candidatus Obscuribacterales bacterium]|nr:DUF1501 domain-containing protein [Candidatus Obscuribacterales bacterium]